MILRHPTPNVHLGDRRMKEITISRLAGLLGITTATVLRRATDGRLPPPSDPARLAWRLQDVTSILTAESERLRNRAKTIDTALRGS